VRAGRRIVLDCGLQDKDNSPHRSWGAYGAALYKISTGVSRLRFGTGSLQNIRFGTRESDHILWMLEVEL
jgi:hypothetical protein